MMTLRFWRTAVLLLVAMPLLSADPQRGRELYEQKKYQEAIQQLQPLVEGAPRVREARYYLALSLIAVERLDEAQAQLEKLEEMSEGTPTDSDLRVARARILMSRQQYDAAADVLKTVVAQNPDHVDARMFRAETELHRKNYQTVAEDAEKVIALDPANAYAYYYAGIAYSNLRRPDKMADYLDRFLKLAPDAPEAPKVQSLMRSLRR
jgi:tetratricopeptide (TPR) repeat protein